VERTDTSLSNPTTPQYFGVCGQIVAGGNTTTISTTSSIVDGLKSTIAQMASNNNYEVAHRHLLQSGAA